MRFRNGTVVAVLGLLLVVGSLAPAPREDAKERIVSLAKLRLDVIREALRVQTKRMDMGEGLITASRTWTRRFVETQRVAGGDKAEVVSVLKMMIAFEIKNLARLEGMFKVGGATPLEVLDAKDCLLESRIWLAEIEAQ
ncbi:MAG: hypothetical protein JWN86_1812 [Planctomycetota bacterium]|nr:hypothetical protein [Planctomycetota bacterium]